MCGNVAPAAARMRVMQSPDFLLPFGRADTDRVLTKRKQGIWMSFSMSIILMKIDGFMRWRASGVSWEVLEVAPEASWEDPGDLPERPWELLKGPRGSRWRFGRFWGVRGGYLEGSWKALLLFLGWGEFAHSIMKY